METIEIELSRIFVKVVQQGGFTKASELLKIPKSTVSKAVTRLEELTGTKLLLRTTRSHTLTAAGRVFYETCLGPIQVLEDAQKSLFGLDTIVSGHIKLTAPEDLGTYVISQVLGDLAQKHPNMSFDLQYTNKLVDLVKDGFDLAVRIGELEESQLKSRRIGHIHMILVAAPPYLKKYSKIFQPSDLKDHVCLSLSSVGMNRSWMLKSGKKQIKVPIRSQIECNQMTSLMKAAVAGAGILLVPNYLCRENIERGNLVRVLPEWTGQSFPVSLVSPVSIASTARLKVVGDHLFAAIQKELERPLV